MRILLILLFLSSGTMAAEVKIHSAIDSIKIVSNGNVHVILSEPTGANCYSSGRKLKINEGQMGVTAEGLDRMLSILLTAKATNSPVRLWFDDSNRNCTVGSMEL
ncbi:hypothetical protein [Marinimicrobium locisalis]|uniref:hypothetical protein n=1 Tax=Marinimicrobium locisalis TaxID=546022 RepID=UPI003221C593